ncbi:MAG: ATP-binding cassette domain-containing protein [Gracilibacteraceae bacterium]|jgi:peptide/nickel transport system ATP-binding protein/oligopeptide transport system ATP-binding protein|nr:ATP-binding cassette domain-containing protein [Gracilibacteraceae bacterium]
MTEQNDGTLVSVENMVKYFPLRGHPFRRQYVKAVDGVSFAIRRGETFGLVGESGCGKSTLGRALAALYPLSAGRVLFAGQDIAALQPRELKSLRQKIQVIFQDPSASLNPRVTIGRALEEPFRIHRAGRTAERQERIAFLLERVGLSDYHLSRYPHELSGGQKQRVGIARALALNPELIVCDEAVSALDVSIQAQVLNLLADLQEEFHLTYLFISHNLNVVHHVSNRVGVMYLGKLVEIGSHRDIYARPRHPYTQALISAIPRAEAGGGGRIILTGDVPSPVNPPAGCRFHTRCPRAAPECGEREPLLLPAGEDHYAACHFPGGEPGA